MRRSRGPSQSDRGGDSCRDRRGGPAGNEEIVRDVCRSHDLHHVGFAPAEAAPAREKEYRRWLSRGYHGGMNYLCAQAAAKYDPRRILPGAATVIMAAVNYFQPDDRTGVEATKSAKGPGSADTAGRNPGPVGHVSVYAWGRDYHKVLGARVRRIARELGDRFPGETFRPFVDTLPLAERYYAAKAGLGFVGRNTLLINGEYGSWVFLCGILTTLLPRSLGNHRCARESAAPVIQCPSACRLCIDACPTNALYAPYRLDASRCVSYLTIERRGKPSEGPGCEKERTSERLIGDRLFGCDVCQRVCPFNRNAVRTQEPDFLNWIAGPRIPLDAVDALSSHDEMTARFGGSPLMRAGVDGLRRNARIVRRNISTFRPSTLPCID